MIGDSEYGATLKNAVKAAVKHTVAAVSARHRGESLNGYAILTDDDLRTLGHLASTKQFTERESHADYNVRFEAVNWTYDDGTAAFDAPRRLLVGSADAATTEDLFSTHVDESFSALVAALREVKSEGLFSDEVFLTVISTDPSEHLERLEEGAVRALNSAELYQQWKVSIA